jgi:putative IMPACT (imprinted ancient) family translation regulator
MSTPSPYTTLQGRVSCEREIKKSKFIAIAAPVQNERAAMAFLDEVLHPLSTHCLSSSEVRILNSRL